MSKYPVTPIHLDYAYKDDEGFISAYRVDIDGRLITIFNVHLQSIGLTNDDKSLYGHITQLKPGTGIDSVKTRLIDKLSAANVKRARQVRHLMQYIRLYGGPDAIICGDFNDVPGCYAIRTFADCGFRSAYPDTGNGPIITFNANRFYFCIDHVLYRGALRPLSSRKGKLNTSDHYPLEVTFELTKKSTASAYE